jgi:hypothetical protein
VAFSCGHGQPNQDAGSEHHQPFVDCL